MRGEGRRGGLYGALREKFKPFIDITNKYRTPRIKMTRGVKLALLALRIYLILMILILAYKFFTTVG